MEDNIKIDLGEIGCENGVNSDRRGWVQHSNESSGFI
jgi:hypothetical protein